MSKLNFWGKKNFYSKLYETNFGIKSTNQLIKSDLFGLHAKGPTRLCEPKELFLCLDGLKDDNTWLDVNIADSPHTELMNSLISNCQPQELMQNRYIELCMLGALDFRKRQKLKKTDIILRFRERLELVKSGNYNPVKVIKIRGRIYIADGKHTAALAMVTDKSVKIVDCSSLIYDSFYYWIYRKMLSSKHHLEYQKHILFFENIFQKI